MKRSLSIVALVATPALSAQTINTPLTPGAWTASDSLRVETFLGRESVYIDKGAAVITQSDFRDGTIELDMAGTAKTNFMGIAFHATDPDNAEVVFLRIGSSGTSEAVQYGPALNGRGAAWQVYHGDGANAVATLSRNTWIHIKIDVAGSVAKIFVGDSVGPTLVVPHLAGVDGRRVGIWTGNFGRGAYFSNIRWTPRPPIARATPTLPRGTIADWEISDVIDAPSLTPTKLPNFGGMKWQAVRAESPGFVLLNRYRRAPMVGLPTDSVTRSVLADSVMGGRVSGTKVVFARTTVDAERDGLERLRFGYSDGVVIFCNGTPLYFGMNPPFFRDLGVMDREGDAVYLPLRKGKNEIVFAVTEYSGGWAFFGRLDR
jgi:hypothetical protein